MHVRDFGLMRKVVLGSTRQHFTLRLQYRQYRLPLALVLPQVSKKSFILRLVLSYPFQAPFDEPLDVLRIQCQPS